jgi:hypothetical protein
MAIDEREAEQRQRAKEVVQSEQNAYDEYIASLFDNEEEEVETTEEPVTPAPTPTAIETLSEPVEGGGEFETDESILERMGNWVKTNASRPAVFVADSIDITDALWTELFQMEEDIITEESLGKQARDFFGVEEGEGGYPLISAAQVGAGKAVTEIADVGAAAFTDEELDGEDDRSRAFKASIEESGQTPEGFAEEMAAGVGQFTAPLVVAAPLAAGGTMGAVAAGTVAFAGEVLVATPEDPGMIQGLHQAMDEGAEYSAVESKFYSGIDGLAIGLALKGAGIGGKFFIDKYGRKLWVSTDELVQRNLKRAAEAEPKANAELDEITEQSIEAADEATASRNVSAAQAVRELHRLRQELELATLNNKARLETNRPMDNIEQEARDYLSAKVQGKELPEISEEAKAMVEAAEFKATQKNVPEDIVGGPNRNLEDTPLGILDADRKRRLDSVAKDQAERDEATKARLLNDPERHIEQMEEAHKRVSQRVEEAGDSASPRDIATLRRLEKELADAKNGDLESGGTMAAIKRRQRELVADPNARDRAGRRLERYIETQEKNLNEKLKKGLAEYERMREELIANGDIKLATKLDDILESARGVDADGNKIVLDGEREYLERATERGQKEIDIRKEAKVEPEVVVRPFGEVIAASAEQSKKIFDAVKSADINKIADALSTGRTMTSVFDTDNGITRATQEIAEAIDKAKTTPVALRAWKDAQPQLQKRVDEIRDEVGVQQFRDIIDELVPGNASLEAKVAAIEVMRDTVAKRTTKLARVVFGRASGEATDKLTAEAFASLQVLREMTLAIGGRASRVDLAIEGLDAARKGKAPLHQKTKTMMGTEKGRKTLQSVFYNIEQAMDTGTPADVRARDILVSTKPSNWDKGFAFANSLRITSMLSGIGTHTKNILGGGVLMVAQPASIGLEKALLGQFKEATEDTIAAYGDLFTVFWSMMRSKAGADAGINVRARAGEALRTGDSQLGGMDQSIIGDATAGQRIGVNQNRGPLSQIGFDSTQQGPIGTLGRVTDTILGFNNRLMVAEDELMRGANHYVRMRQEARILARQKGISPGTIEWDEFQRAVALSAEYADDDAVYRQVWGGFGDKRPTTTQLREIHEKSVDEGLYRTFQNDLDYNRQFNIDETTGATGGPLGALDKATEGALDIAGRVRSVPLIGSILVPFLKTPVNVTRYAMERFPVAGLVMRRNRDQMLRAQDLLNSTNPAEVQEGKIMMAQVMSRQMVGGMAAASTAYLAMNNMITGGGPIDPARQAQWRAAGFEPYSVRTPNGWVSYKAAFETLTPTISVIADTVFHIQNSEEGELSEERAAQALIAVAYLGRVLADVPHAQAFNEIVNMTTDARITSFEDINVAEVGRGAGRLAGSYIPYSSLLKSLSRGLDEETINMSNELRGATFGEEFANQVSEAAGIIGDVTAEEGDQVRINIFGEPIVNVSGIARIDEWVASANPIKKFLGWGAQEVMRSAFKVTDDPDPIDKMFFDLDMNVSVTREFGKINGQRLNAEQMTMYAEMTGSSDNPAAENGMSMREEIAWTIQQDWYLEQNDAGRKAEIRTIINGRKKEAMDMMMAEYDGLVEAGIDREIENAKYDDERADLELNREDYIQEDRADLKDFYGSDIEKFKNNRERNRQALLGSLISNEEQD